MIFLPKGRGEYRGIGFVEVVWKVCAAVVSCRLNRSLILHDALHGFRAGSCTGTANLEVKLAQQLAGLVHESLFQMFWEVRKAYNSLDRDGVWRFCGVMECATAWLASSLFTETTNSLYQSQEGF